MMIYRLDKSIEVFFINQLHMPSFCMPGPSLFIHKNSQKCKATELPSIRIRFICNLNLINYLSMVVGTNNSIRKRWEPEQKISTFSFAWHFK